MDALNDMALAEIRRVVDDLACGAFASIEADGRIGRLTQEGLRRAIAEYGRTLVSLPANAVDAMDVYPRDNDPSLTSVDVDLYTLEEGRSDLTLSVDLLEVDGTVTLSITNLYVH